MSILNGMGNEMGRNLASVTDKEETAIKECEEFIAAEKKEVDTLTASIETQTQRIGEPVVATMQTKKRPLGHGGGFPGMNLGTVQHFYRLEMVALT